MNNKCIEQYTIRYELDKWLCQHPKCNRKTTQIAHRLARTKVNYSVYGKEVIDHNINLVSVCCLEHNSYYNLANKPRKARKLAGYIRKNRNRKIKSKMIQEYIDNC